MKKLLLAVSMVAVSLFSGIASAETVTFKDHFTAETPAGWTVEPDRSYKLTIISPKKDISVAITEQNIFDKNSNEQIAKKYVKNFGANAINFKKVNNNLWTFQNKFPNGNVHTHYRYVFPKGEKYWLTVAIKNPSDISGKNPINEKAYKKQIDAFIKSVKKVK